MSSSNGNNSAASNRTSIFETFNSSTFDADAEDFVVVNHNVKPVKSVVRRSFDNPKEPPQEVEGFEEPLGQGTDDVECIEEEEENQDYTLFMSCSPGRISTEEDESDEQLIFSKGPENNKKKKKPSVPKHSDKPRTQKQPKQTVREPKKQQKQRRQEKEEEEDPEYVDEEEAERALAAKESKKQRRKQQREEEENEDEEMDSHEHQTVKESKKQQQEEPQTRKEPKKPLSAYALFYRDTQSAIKSQNAKATFGEVSKIVATMWDNLDQPHRKVYENQAEEDKETYLQDMVQYRHSCKLQQRNLEAEKKDKTSHVRPYVPHHKPSWAKTASVEEENHNDDSWSSHESPEPPADAVVKKSLSSLCNRSNCPNRAVDDPRWTKDYCSTECVISHCRDVFTAWVSSRHSTWKSDV